MRSGTYVISPSNHGSLLTSAQLSKVEPIAGRPIDDIVNHEEDLEEDKLINPGDAADYLGVSAATNRGYQVRYWSPPDSASDLVNVIPRATYDELQRTHSVKISVDRESKQVELSAGSREDVDMVYKKLTNLGQFYVSLVAFS